MASQVPEIHGFVNPDFEPVRKAFADNFADFGDVGACVCVTQDGEPVVDIWAGDADPRGTPWQRDTIVNVYSTTKTMAAISVLVLADRGAVDLAAPVASYWPEFAQGGKERVTVSHVMSHSAGLSGFDPPLEKVEELYDWNAVCERLAAQAPWWEPGTQPGYHALTQGFLQGEIVRRVTGKSIGTFFREEIAEPLGADFHIGLPAEADARMGELIPPPGGAGDTTGDWGEVAEKTFASGSSMTGEEPRTTAWRRAEIPAAGGIGNARSVARVHAAIACGGTLDGVTLMSEAGVAKAHEEQVRGTDLVLQMPVVFGNGFGLTQEAFPIGPNPRAFYWGGWGGSLAVIDLDARLSIAYVMNKMEANLAGDLRGIAIVAGVYESPGVA